MDTFLNTIYDVGNIILFIAMALLMKSMLTFGKVKNPRTCDLGKTADGVKAKMVDAGNGLVKVVGYNSYVTYTTARKFEATTPSVVPMLLTPSQAKDLAVEAKFYFSKPG